MATEKMLFHTGAMYYDSGASMCFLRACRLAGQWRGAKLTLAEKAVLKEGGSIQGQGRKSRLWWHW